MWMFKRNSSLLIHLNLNLEYVDVVVFLKPSNISIRNTTHNKSDGILNNRAWPIRICLSADA